MDPNPESHGKHFENNFPEDVVRTATSKGFLGGIYDPAKAGFLDRLIYKAVAKQSAYVNSISDQGIDAFIRELNI